MKCKRPIWLTFLADFEQNEAEQLFNLPLTPLAGVVVPFAVPLLVPCGVAGDNGSTDSGWLPTESEWPNDGPENPFQWL